MSRTARRVLLVNTIGTFGYLSLLLQWCWCIIIVGYPFISGDHSFLFPANAPRTVQAAEPTNFGAFTPFVFIIAVSVSIAVLILTVITIARLPQQIGRSGRRITRTAATILVPVATHHKPVAKKRFVRLTYQASLAMKFGTSLLAILLLAIAPPIPQLPHTIIWTVAGYCLAWTFIFFVAQHILGRLLRVDRDTVW